MSLSVPPEMHDLLKSSHKKLGKSVSEIIRILVEKHLDLVVHNDEEIPVIMKIPASLKGDKEALRAWLDSKTNAIVEHLGKTE